MTTILIFFKSLAKQGRKYFFNNALNTFYLQLYGITHMVRDHSD